MIADERDADVQGQHSEQRPFRVRLPGFVADDDVGLGDVVKRVTSTLGIRPCGGCERRAAALNSWFVFTRRTK
jgi:hypothetical protein